MENVAERDSTSDASNDPTKTALEAPNSLSLPTKMRFANGTTLGHYEVLEPLGQGGMGEVYLARDTRLGRRVALKFLTHVTSTQSARFFVEARATAQLAHENIVSLYDIAEHEGLPYMVLEYVPGKTLSTWLRERRHGDFFDPVLPIQAAEMMLSVVRALQCAHEAGIVHRDLKPANIMLAKSGTVKVLDFGVAKLIATAQPGVEGDAPLENPESWVKQATTAADLTETGAMVGTRSYMAPEQWWGDEVDGRTDIWAVGIMMYIMVVGDHPLAPLTPSSIVHVAERHLPMPRIADVMPTLGELGSIIDRCLRKDMDERWSCARELAEALDRFIRVSTSIRPPQTESNSFGIDKHDSTSMRISVGRLSLDDGALDMAKTVDELPRKTAPNEAATTDDPSRTSKMTEQGSPGKTKWVALAALIALLGAGLGGFVLNGRKAAPAGNAAAATSATECVGDQCSPRECSTNVECGQKFDGRAGICRQDTGRCISLETAGCRILASKKDVENDATVWIGAMYPVSIKGSDYGKRAARAVELGWNDFQQLGGIPAATLGGKSRPLGVVLCDDAEDHERIAKHLIDVVRVPVILGFARSKEVMDLATSFFLPQGVMALASNTGSTLVDIPHLPGEPRLVWRVTSSADMINPPKAKFIEQILEPLLRSRGVLKRNETMRIALIRVNNTASLSHADKLISHLSWIGKSALENGDSVQQFVVPDELDNKGRTDELQRVARAVTAFAPHVVAEVGADVQPLLLIEREWLATTPFRPVYATSIGLNKQTFAALLREHPDGERRLFNVDTKTTLTAKKFAMHHNEVFTDEKIEPATTTTAPYDAFYTAAYAIIALGDEPVTGKSLSRTIMRLVPPGEPIEVGPANIYKATKLLRDGKNVDLIGAQTSLDFDPETGDPTIDSAIICLDSNTHTAIDSGLVYDVRAAKWSGVMNCP